MIEYIATFKTAMQISPDDWATYNPTMKVTEETPVSEIIRFFHSYCPGSTLIEIKIINIAQP